MCVICIARDKRPDEDIVRAMWDQNDAGAGFAWREVQGNGKNARTMVKWAKGLMKVEEAIEFAKELPLPYVAHFRIPTVGGRNRYLTHPFGLDEGASVALDGTTNVGVLFHNGHFNPWKESIRELVISAGGQIKLPGGPWSDSRAMAFLMAHIGPGMLEFFGEKLVHFTPNSIELGNAGSFTLSDGLIYSNMSWKHRLWRSPYTTPPASMSGDKDKEDHSPARSVENQSLVLTGGNGSQGASGTTNTENGGRPYQSPFGKPSLLKYRIPETGAVVSKKALKRWRKTLALRAARGDRAAQGWQEFIDSYPSSMKNPEAWPTNSYETKTPSLDREPLVTKSTN